MDKKTKAAKTADKAADNGRFKMHIADGVVNDRWQNIQPSADSVHNAFRPAVTLGYDGKGTAGARYKAHDAALKRGGYYSLLLHSLDTIAFSALPQFLGYGILTGLTQNGLIRAGVEMIANEMTREWIEVKRANSDGDTANTDNAAGDRIAVIEREMRRLNVREVFKKAMELCGYYGGCLVYIDTGESDPQRLKMPLVRAGAMFERESLRGLVPIEPYNIAPGSYDASRPWSRHYFEPVSWFVQGQEIHASRFLYFAVNPVPTLIKPSYNFFGIPTAQVVLDVVEHFTKCREAAARLLEKFSMTIFKTDMSGILQGGGRTELDRRIQFMCDNRDNDAIIAINAGDLNTGGEDIIKVDTALGGVTDIVRQSMEMVAAYFNEPVIKLWGISPAGFNATGDADLQNHYDHIMTQQNAVFRDCLDDVLTLIQLNTFGDCDRGITFDFIPLNKEDERTIVETQKARADIDAVLIAAGVISQEEARARVAADPDSGYNSLDADNLPDPLDDFALEGLEQAAGLSAPQG